MTAPASADELLELLRSRIPRDWLDACTSTPDGEAMLGAAIDMFVALDARDAERMSGLRVAPHSCLPAEPASGARVGTTTLAFVRRRAGAAMTLPIGTLAQTPDGHVFRTLAPVAFGPQELDVEKTVDAEALVAGHFAVIPPGEITQFTPVAKGLSGTGLGIEFPLAVVEPGRALRLWTDATKPHPFRSTIVGLPVEILTATGALAPNVGRQVQIDRITTGPALNDPPAYETGWAWGAVTLDTSTDWALALAPFEWVARDWNEIGFEVRNTTLVVGARDGLLDAMAEARGRPRRPGEGDESVRTRLRRRPLRPCPLGLLELVVLAIAPYGFGRHDVRIYELGIVPVGETDALAENFQAAGGYLTDLHVTDLATPHTPDSMARRTPNGATLATFVNPGLIGEHDVGPWTFVVRILIPSGFDETTARQIRLAAWEAIETGRQRGSVGSLYHVQTWGYP